MKENQEREAVYSKLHVSPLAELDFTIIYTPHVWLSKLVMRLTQLPFSDMLKRKTTKAQMEE